MGEVYVLYQIHIGAFIDNLIYTFPQKCSCLNQDSPTNLYLKHPENCNFWKAAPQLKLDWVEKHSWLYILVDRETAENTFYKILDPWIVPTALYND